MKNITDFNQYKAKRDIAVTHLEEYSLTTGDMLLGIHSMLTALDIRCLGQHHSGDTTAYQVLALSHIVKITLTNILISFPVLSGYSVRRYNDGDQLSLYMWCTDPESIKPDTPYTSELELEVRLIEDDDSFDSLRSNVVTLDVSDIDFGTSDDNLIQTRMIKRVISNLNSLVETNGGDVRLSSDGIINMVLPYNHRKTILLQVIPKTPILIEE